MEGSESMLAEGSHTCSGMWLSQVYSEHHALTDPDWMAGKLIKEEKEHVARA